MSSLVKAITLRATYEGDISGLKKDAAAIKSFGRQMAKRPLLIPLRLDLTGLKAQAAAAAASYQKALNAAMAKNPMAAAASGGTSQGGIAIPPGAMQSLKSYATTAGTAFKTVSTEAGKLVTTYEQLEAGAQRITRFNKQGSKASAQIIDTRRTAQLQQRLDQAGRDEAANIGAARGSGSKPALATAISRQKAAVEKAIKDFADLENTPAMRRANRMLDSLDRTLATTGASGAKQAASGIADRRIRSIDQVASRRLEENKSSRDAAKRLPDATARERAYNATLAEREKILNRAANAHRRLAQAASRSGQSNVADRHTTAANRFDRQLHRHQAAAEIARRDLAAKAQAEADRSAKTAQQTAAARADRRVRSVGRGSQSELRRNQEQLGAANLIRSRQAREAAINRTLAEREAIIRRTAAIYKRLEESARRAGMAKAADKFRDAGAAARHSAGMAGNQASAVARGQSAGRANRIADREVRSLQRSYGDEKARLATEESLARQIKNRTQRERELNRVLAERTRLNNQTAARASRIARVARRGGMDAIANRAEGIGTTAGRDQQSIMRKIGTDANRSGHAVNFHTQSMLRNAGTFVKWMIPAMAVMRTINTITQGFQRAIAVQRTFRTLNAVFRGTREESDALARATLSMASAYGRSGDEAAQAAVTWSRLGLTKNQVLVAMESSLRAANVAQISTAEATKYLAANYRAFQQTLADIPMTMDTINSLSNQYNVRPIDIFQGMARTANVARMAGFDQTQLASIMAIVTDATGRPGEETGNALKFILTRLRRTDTINTIQKDFGVNLTESTGDVNTIYDIFTKLATIYPTLGRLEQSRLNDLVAGSRQTERWAVIINNWTEILFAQAKAAADSNSAQRENELILTSLESTIQRLSTAWTDFLYTLGEVGIFDTIGTQLDKIAYRMQIITKERQQGMESPQPGSLDALTPDARQFVKDSFKHHGVIPSDADRFPQDAVAHALQFLRKDMESEPKTKMEKHQESLLASRLGYNVQNRAINVMSEDQKVVLANELQRYLDDELTGRHKSMVMDSNMRLAVDFKQMEMDAGGLEAGASGFEAMSRDILTGRTATGKLVKQFDSGAAGLDLLPDGSIVRANAFLEILPLIENENREEASKALIELANAMRTRRDEIISMSEATRVDSLAVVEKSIKQYQVAIAKMRADMSKMSDEQSMTALEDDITRTINLLREATEAAGALRRAIAFDTGEIMDPAQNQNLENYFKNLQIAAEIFGQMQQGFANSGSARVDSILLGQSAMMQRTLAEETSALTRSENDTAIQELEFQITATRADPNADQNKLNALQREIQLRTEVGQKIDYELAKIRDATADTEYRVELERQRASLTEANADAASSMRSGFDRFDVGLTEGDRLLARQSGIEADMQALRSSAPAYGNTPDNETQAVSTLGRITEALSQGKQNLLSIEDRLNRTIADRANLELEITEQARLQREERSRTLAMASREDQLRAAAAAATLRNQGRDAFTLPEFSYFTQDTRSALSSLMPGSVTGLDTTERDNQESRTRLNHEIESLTQALQPAKDRFREMAEIAALGVEALGNFIRPRVTPGMPIALGEDETRLNLNVGDISINLDLSTHIAALTATLQSRFDTRLDAALRDIRNAFRSATDPTAPAVEAW